MNGAMREMVAADVPALVALDAAATGAPEARNPEFVRLALARNPEGCFLITQAGTVRAGCCTHAAGPVGVITLLLAQPGAEADTQLAALLCHAVDALGTRTCSRSTAPSETLTDVASVGTGRSYDHCYVLFDGRILCRAGLVHLEAGRAVRGESGWFEAASLPPRIAALLGQP